MLSPPMLAREFVNLLLTKSPKIVVCVRSQSETHLAGIADFGNDFVKTIVRDAKKGAESENLPVAKYLKRRNSYRW